LLYAGRKESGLIYYTMEKLFDKLPYDDLEGIQVTHLFAGAIGIGFALFLAYFFTLYSATGEEFAQLTKQKEGAERTFKEYKAVVAKEPLVAKNMARVKGRFDAFKNQMPSQDEIPTLMRRLTAFGKDRNIKMTELTMEEGAIEDFYKEIPFKIEIKGELWVTLDFIEYVQNLLRLVSFENLILQGQGGAVAEGAPVGSLRTTLTAKTYSFLEGSENRAPKKQEPPNSAPAKKKTGH
jgi:Tfp pilus assembly protein PilO